MAEEDILHSVDITADGTVHYYTKWRIDYNDDIAISELVDPDDYEARFKNPPAGYDGHLAKSNYQRKVLISDATDADTAKDDIVAALDAGYTDDEGNTISDIGTVTEELTISADEKAAVEEYDAKNSLEGHDALRWVQAIEDLDASHITIGDFEKGKNPHRGYEFGGPGNSERGRGKAKAAGRPDDPGRPDHPSPIDKGNGK